MTLRELIREVLDDVAPDLGKKDQGIAERKLIKGLTTLLVSEGFTVAMAAKAMDVPPTTLHTWRQRDDTWRQDLKDAREVTRGWLLGMLRLHLEYETTDGEGRATGIGGRAASAAMNILSNLWFEELRTQRIEAVVSNAPAAGDSLEAVLAAVNKGKPD